MYSGLIFLEFLAGFTSYAEMPSTIVYNPYNTIDFIQPICKIQIKVCMDTGRNSDVQNR